MAERRMFAKTIIDSDAFLDMPLSTQALYFHLSMRADDEGFINNPRKIQRMIGAADDDLKVLIAKNFVIRFESGIVVIKHWRIHNYIRGDRLHETKYIDERSMLQIKENGAYTPQCQTNVGQLTDECPTYDGQMDGGCPTEVRLGKDSIGKVSIESKSRAFTPPSLEDVKTYCLERNNRVDAQRFIDFYESKGWFVGKNKMKDWKAAVRTWEQREYESKETTRKKPDVMQRNYSNDELDDIVSKKLGGG